MFQFDQPFIEKFENSFNDDDFISGGEIPFDGAFELFKKL